MKKPNLRSRQHLQVALVHLRGAERALQGAEDELPTLERHAATHLRSELAQRTGSEMSESCGVRRRAPG